MYVRLPGSLAGLLARLPACLSVFLVCRLTNLQRANRSGEEVVVLETNHVLVLGVAGGDVLDVLEQKQHQPLVELLRLGLKIRKKINKWQGTEHEMRTRAWRRNGSNPTRPQESHSCFSNPATQTLILLLRTPTKHQAKQANPTQPQHPQHMPSQAKPSQV